jgi:hypothetical protein
MGGDDQDASRSHGQLHKKPLELDNEEEEHLTDVDPFR